jgi:OOP family OmpA-OmpF porin
VLFIVPISALGADKGCYFSSKAGIYSPESDDLEDFDTGFSGEVALGHYFNPNFALEFGVGYFETDYDSSSICADIYVMPVTISVKPTLPIGNLDLYALGGAGAYYTTGEIDSYDDSGIGWGPHAGAGASYRITDNISLGVEGKYLWADAGLSPDVDLDGYTVMGVFTLHLGVKKETEPPSSPIDSDGDGVPDNLDKCPDTPRGVRVDSSGCPIDSDGDGVPDNLDKCPDTPKGVKVDSDGCPLDSDGDGVPDFLDTCPDTPKGTKVDSSGCPLDTDGDGVPDYRDECPNTPKGATVNSKGCWALTGMVLFDFNSANLKEEVFPLLDEVVKILEKNPEIKGEIQGHTDSRGAEAYNQDLSERRAKAVEDYLESKGIDRARLTSKGYGETQPIASNDTEEGRRENRRVELKRTQ